MSNWQNKVGELSSKVTDAVEQQKQRIAQGQESNALQRQIQILLEQKAELYFQAGKSLHDFVRKGNSLPAGLEISHEKLLEIDVNIFNLQEKLHILEQSQTGLACSACNEPIQAGDRFCGSCGQKQEEPKAGPKVQCGHCGQAIPAHASFCNVCGISQSVVKSYAL